MGVLMFTQRSNLLSPRFLDLGKHILDGLGSEIRGGPAGGPCPGLLQAAVHCLPSPPGRALGRFRLPSAPASGKRETSWPVWKGGERQEESHRLWTEQPPILS